jgi:preprotein translocase subunit SecD
LPGVQDTAEIKRIIGATATLEFRAVVGSTSYAQVAQTALDSGLVPPDARLYYLRSDVPGEQGAPVLLSKRLIVAGEQLVDARPGVGADTGMPEVSIELSAAGGNRMFSFSSENVGEPMAVVYIEKIPVVRMVDGVEVREWRTREEVISVSIVQEPLGRAFRTTGLASAQEASDLAKLIRAGALSAPMAVIEERVIGPSLGADNVRRGVQAVVGSFLFVLAFFLVYYRMFGLITNIALLLNLLMVIAVMSVFGATITLPGLAGIALTVGLSVDANVLVNERIREELRAGNSPLASIATGFDKAAGTIADANVTALLAGLALLAFGTGPIQSFAITLILGILTSLYTAVSVSRGVATLIYGRRRKLSSIAI